MTDPQKKLSGKEKFDLAEKTLVQTLNGLNFRTDVIGEYFLSIEKENRRTLLLLQKIEHGVDEFGRPKGIFKRPIAPTFGPTGRTVAGIEVWDLNPNSNSDDRQLLRASKTALEAFIGLVGTIFTLDRNAIKTNGLRLHRSVITDKGNRSKLEVIQLCFLQMLAHDNQIEPRHFQYFREAVSYLRKRLEATRIELYLHNQPTYTEEIRHADLFIKILEQRVKMWDKTPLTKRPLKKKS
jgi:hypothetical protein